MKKIIIGLLLSSMVFGFNAEVKKASVKLTINDVIKAFNVDEKFILNAGDVVCFIEGDGRVVIEDKFYNTQLSKKSSICKHLPSKDGKIISHYSQSFSRSVVAMFQQSKEKSVDGVSRESTKSNVLTVPIYMSKDIKYLAIENSTWGPLPIVLELYNEKDEMVKKIENKKDLITSFILPRSMLKEGYSIKITNRFNDLLVKSKIHFQSISTD